VSSGKLRGPERFRGDVTASELGLDNGPLEVRDLWSGESREVADGVISASIEPHGVTILRIKSAAAVNR